MDNFENSGNVATIYGPKLSMKVTSESIPNLIKQGMSHFYETDFLNALDIFQSIIRFMPSLVDARIRLGMCYLALGEFDKAESEFNITNDLDDDNPELYFCYGNLYYKRENFETSIDFYNKALTLAPKFDRAFFNKALSFVNQDKLNEAIELIPMTLCTI